MTRIELKIHLYRVVGGVPHTAITNEGIYLKPFDTVVRRIHDDNPIQQHATFIFDEC